MSASSYSNASSFAEDDPEKMRKRQAECIRNVANFSKVESYHMMDKSNFIPELLQMYLKEAGPKVEALMERIQQLDEQDLEKEGKHFKHMIFTDVKNSSYGAKLIGSAFVAKGYQPSFHVQGPGFALHPDEKLSETPGQNFGILMSKNFYDRPMSIKFRKHLMETYNRRPENVQGNLVRFIILDQGFKEGIDLFDVKYVHLFEPLVVKADEKQAIGRGTRFCGQSGLKFHPKYGWPLYVFRYEVQIPKEVPKEIRAQLQDAKQMFELYLQYANIDLRKVVFAAELEKAAIDAAADKDLTTSIHQFKMDLPPPILKGGSGIPLEELIRRTKIMGLNINKLKPIGHHPEPPSKKMNLEDMHKFVRAKFRTLAYPNIKLENQCVSTSGGASIVDFTPTQNFVRHYFQPSSAYKGMLLFHGVGVGKTCCAIATATTSFEREGYNILWVTRHTLKNDIWKNMYKQVCSLTLQEKIKDGTLKLPANIVNPKKYLPDNWIEPISYKQFSNLLLEKNKYYEEIVKRNGKEDPLRKTLVIIDEAHKLYSPTVAGSEKPRMDILEKMIQNSYDKSGKDSVRILLMTATPYTEDAMEMIQLLNLLREKEPLITDFEAFKDEYLDSRGYFKPKSLVKFQNQISGYISYLNRGGDARNFAYPVLQDVYVDLTHPYSEKDIHEDKYKAWLHELREDIAEHKGFIKKKNIEMKKEQNDCKEELKQKKADMKEKAKIYIEQKMEKLEKEKQKHLKNCDELLDKKKQKSCIKEANAEYKKAVKEIKEEKKTIGKTCVPKQEKCVVKPNTSVEKEIQERKEQLDLLKDEKLQVDAQLNVIKAELKKYSTKVKALRISYNKKRTELKIMKHTIVVKRQAIRKISDKEHRKAVQKEFRATILKEFKEKQKEIKLLRGEISFNTQQKRLYKIKAGKAALKDVSQLTALEKRCKIDIQ